MNSKSMSKSMISLILLATTLTFIAQSNNSWARGNLIEIPVQQVFIPSVGYDDNDNIEAVVVGELPSPCYTIGPVNIQKQGDKINVVQMAWEDLNLPCSNGDLMDDTVPFNSIAKLGRLNVNSYKIQFSQQQGPTSRTFNVAKAPTARIDNADYASVSQVTALDIYLPTQDVEVQLQGFFNFTCFKLKQPVLQKKLGDVIVLLPVIESIDKQNCEKAPRNFSEKVNLGHLDPGTYVVHVRSREGAAQYRVINVLKPL